MQMPNTIHPKKFAHKGALFQVVTYEPVSDEQARQILIFYLRSQRTKFQKGKLYQLLYNNSAGTFF